MFNSVCKRVCKNLGSSYSTKSINPFNKTWKIISDDAKLKNVKIKYPEHADIVIIGGGFIGSSVAYWLKNRSGKEGLSVVVLEKDLTFQNSQNILSLNSLTQHYSLPENVSLSQFSADFFRNIKEYLGNDINIQFTPHDYLLLASEKYANNLEVNVQVQKENGVSNKLISVEEIRKRYPWINTSDVKVGCISVENEGVFNSWNFLKGLVQKSVELGTNYVEAEVTGFEMDVHRDVLMEGATPGLLHKLNKVVYKTKDNEEYQIKFAVCVVAAGTGSNQIANLAGIGSQSEGLLSVPLPLGNRDYKVYSVSDSSNKTKLKLNTPFVMDTSGLWLRKNGLQNDFICSQLPLIKNEPDFSEDEYYNNVFMPSLINRIPNYKDVKISTLSTEIQDSNTYDDSGILGPHPYYTNLYLATGFGRQGVQHAPGIGRSMAELIVDCQFTSIDLTRFGFDRILMDLPLLESNIY